MKMDSHGSDQSPPLDENGVGMWSHVWDTEVSSFSALINLENSAELKNLVEDKEIAARAVAFVVNSTRKGVVPLCADVATIFRMKRSLERKILRLKSENESLRSQTESGRTSRSESPTPASITSYSDRGSLHEHSHLQGRCSPTCSHCSSVSSSLISNSPSSVPLRSPRLHPASAFNAVLSDNHNMTVAAQVHALPNGVIPHGHRPRRHKHRRKHSLPEMVDEPGENVPKISPKAATASVEVQCRLSPSDRKLEDKLRDTLQANSQLTEELEEAKTEIETLRDKLKLLEMGQLARRCSEQFYIENETEPPLPCWCASTPSATKCSSPTDRNSAVLPAISDAKPGCHAHAHSHSSSACATSSGSRVPSSPSPVLLPCPLKGCKCDSCLNAQGHTEVEYSCDKTTGIHVQIGDHVVVKGDRTGHVRYIGHLDVVGQTNLVFVGVELDAPVGEHDGMLNKKQYFTCVKDCGIFLPVHEVICAITRARSSPCCRPKVERRPSDQDKGKPPKSPLTKKNGKDKKYPAAVSGACLKLVKEVETTELV